MDVVLAATLVKAALDAGNIVKLATEFWGKFKRAPTPDEFTKLESDANKRAEQVTIPPQIGAMSLSDEMIPVLLEQMNTIKKRIADTYRDTGLSSFDKQQQTDRIQRDYCFYMKEIRRFNSNKLPAPLENEWESNSCSKYAF
jgi:hypothetical protein